MKMAQKQETIAAFPIKARPVTRREKIILITMLIMIIGQNIVLMITAY